MDLMEAVSAAKVKSAASKVDRLKSKDSAIAGIVASLKKGKVPVAAIAKISSRSLRNDVQEIITKAVGIEDAIDMFSEAAAFGDGFTAAQKKRIADIKAKNLRKRMSPEKRKAELAALRKAKAKDQPARVREPRGKSAEDETNPIAKMMSAADLNQGVTLNGVKFSADEVRNVLAIIDSAKTSQLKQLVVKAADSNPKALKAMLAKLTESYVVAEVLSPSQPIGDWISDFVDSDHPKFKGKSKEERIEMAKGAWYAAQKQTKKEEVQMSEEQTLAEKKLSAAYIAMKKRNAKKARMEASMDPVDKKAAMKPFSARADKDIDNDGDVDSSDEYLHNRRKAITKKMAEEVELEEAKATMCGRCGTVHVPPKDGGKCPALEEGELDERLERDGPNKGGLGNIGRGTTSSKGREYLAKKAQQRSDMNKKNDPGAAKKGLALSVLDKAKARKKLDQRSMREEAEQVDEMQAKKRREMRDKPPFSKPYSKDSGERKDRYGNTVKNVAKHLAKKGMKQYEEFEEEAATGIKIFYKARDGKEHTTIVFSPSAAREEESAIKSEGGKVTARAVMYGKKQGPRVAVK